MSQPPASESQAAADIAVDRPDIQISVRAVFGLDTPLTVPAFSRAAAQVPDIDPNYRFHPETTLALLMGFAHNRRVLLRGMHGSGKSSHIEQVAARLRWPLVRINLDGHISRVDLLGRDAIVVREGRQITEFQPGMLSRAITRPCALVFDEYDAGRPDVMFVIQRLLEADGRLTLLEDNRIITPHPCFRLFATMNTRGLGDVEGLYHGTQALNQAQLDRWQLMACLDYLSEADETELVLQHLGATARSLGAERIVAMVRLAGLTRAGFIQGDLATLMTVRTVISWAENTALIGDLALAFRLSFMNRCDEAEQMIVAEYFQRCFARSPLDESPDVGSADSAN